MRNLIAIGLLSCSLNGFAVEQEPGKREEGQLPLKDLRTFADVFSQIRNHYVDDVEDRALLKNAIRGMLNGLDPHSAYLDGREYENLQTSATGEFSGLGLEVGMEDGLVKVISPIDDTPAAKAGIISGDLIVRLGDTPVKGMSLNEAIQAMRGKKGTQILLTILREGEEQPMELTLTRDTIKVRSVRSRELEPGFAYVRVAQFQNSTPADVEQAIRKHLGDDENLRGLVLDLRNNPGGVLEAAIGVSDLFLDSGLIVYTEGKQPSTLRRYSAKAETTLPDTPLVVLVNSGSASASEIVAGALQDHKRAVIMGTDSFGKGSVQTVVPISATQAIKLTTALYFTPNGRSIQAQGITPDIRVDRAQITRLGADRRVTEADLKGHLDNINGEDGAERDQEASETASLIQRDNQLYEALTLLKGLDIISKRG